MIETKYLRDNPQNIKKLMAIPVLRKYESKNLGLLLKLSKIRRYKKGEAIIREGETDPWIYFLLSGRVRVEKEGIRIGTISKTGEVFGEMSILDGMARSASVHAEIETLCMAVDTSATNTLPFDARTDILLLLYRVFMEYTTNRLRSTNEELVRTKKKASTKPSEEKDASDKGTWEFVW